MTSKLLWYPIIRCISVIAVIYFSLTGCKKFLAVGVPPDRLVSASVFEDESAATAAVLGIYEQMMESNGDFANGGITLFTGLTGDELATTPVNGDYNEFYANQITPANFQLLSSLWGSAYKKIYQANAVIDGLRNSTLTGPVKDTLIGEALFLRAFFHFYLVNLFGPVPLALGSDYTQNAVLPRTAVADVYRQIEADLGLAIAVLPENYLNNQNVPDGATRSRPNRSTAEALLARAYLYEGKWAEAESTASLLIDKVNDYVLGADLSQVFLAGSTEVIWALVPVLPNYNTGEGNLFVQTSGVPVYAFLDTGLVRDFEPADQRRVNWIDSYLDQSDSFYYPAKYKVNFAATITEEYVVFRLAEQYLIRSEARNELKKAAAAAEDLNVIRHRAGLLPTSAGDYTTLQSAIQNERRHELFCEWGHRWFDLKRTETIGQILSPVKRGWQATDALYPLPRYELQLNAHLTQNPGY